MQSQEWLPRENSIRYSGSTIRIVGPFVKSNKQTSTPHSASVLVQAVRVATTSLLPKRVPTAVRWKAKQLLVIFVTSSALSTVCMRFIRCTVTTNRWWNVESVVRLGGTDTVRTVLYLNYCSTVRLLPALLARVLLW